MLHLIEKLDGTFSIRDEAHMIHKHALFSPGEYGNVDHTEMIQTVMLKCQETEALCNEFYLQLIKQTTDHPGMYCNVILSMRVW